MHPTLKLQYAYHLRGRMVSLQLLSSEVAVKGKLVPYPVACRDTVWLNLEAVYPEVLQEVDAIQHGACGEPCMMLDAAFAGR